MSKKLIAIDLDGTTLNNTSEIALPTKKTIQLLQENGHRVVIATGRPHRSSVHFYSELQLTSPIITLNGAVLHYPGENGFKKPETNTLSRDLAVDVIKFKEHPSVQLIAVETSENVYVSKNYIPYKEFHTRNEKDMLPLDKDALESDPIAILIFTHSDAVHPKITADLLEVYGEDIEVRTWGGTVSCLEITAPGIHKAKAIEKVAHHYNIPESRIVAFGDELNDYEMIKYADHGVVMSNGNERLKTVADAITEKNNDQNGLADYLNKYFK